MIAWFRVTWQSHDNDVNGNHDKHNNKFKCIKNNGHNNVTNNVLERKMPLQYYMKASKHYLTC